MQPVLGNKRDQMTWNRWNRHLFLDLFTSDGLKENKSRCYVCILKSVNEADLWCTQVMSKRSYL